jgi:hypothetical protein
MNSQVNEYELIREENIKRNNEQILLLFGSEPVSKASGIKRTSAHIELFRYPSGPTLKITSNISCTDK